MYIRFLFYTCLMLLFFFDCLVLLSKNLPPDRLGCQAKGPLPLEMRLTTGVALPEPLRLLPSGQGCEHLAVSTSNDYDLILSESMICLEMEHEGQAAMSSKRFSLAHVLSPWLKAEGTTATSS